MGSYIYTKYRIYVRIPIEQAGYWKTQGFFEFKEHVATIGLGAPSGLLVHLEERPEPGI